MRLRRRNHRPPAGAGPLRGCPIIPEPPASGRTGRFARRGRIYATRIWVGDVFAGAVREPWGGPGKEPLLRKTSPQPARRRNASACCSPNETGRTYRPLRKQNRLPAPARSPFFRAFARICGYPEQSRKRTIQTRPIDDQKGVFRRFIRRIGGHFQRAEISANSKRIEANSRRFQTN